LPVLERGLQIAVDESYASLVPNFHHSLAMAANVRGDAEATLRHARRSLETADRIDSPALRTGAHLYIGRGHLMRDEFGLAITELERAHELATEHRVALLLDYLTLLGLAEAHLGMRQLDRARELSVLVSERNSGPGMRARGHLLRAKIELAADDSDSAEIERALEHAAAEFQAAEWYGFATDVVLARAELAALRGDERERMRELREAHRIYSEMGARGHAERVARQLAAPSS
jgi:hypothetical protein